MSALALTATQIPCCLCGTMIYPNAANQCSTCLAQSIDLKSMLQRGPGGAEHVTIYQCRTCRRYQQTPRHYIPAEPESSQLLAICLKHIPALQSHAQPKLQLADAAWIWTEPHSRRFKIRLTIRTEVQNVRIEQRVSVEHFVKYQLCDDCNREVTNRNWHAVVQVRQKRENDKKGLASLEMALSKNASIRKHVLRIDSTKFGFDFYFLHLAQAQALSQYLQRTAPMRVKTSQKMVSEDVKNNVANMKYTVTCDLVPMCRDDLVCIKKTAKGNKLSGRLVLVNRISSVLHLMDASPKRERLQESVAELAAETYYKEEKSYRVLLSATRLVRFVVLDVELCEEEVEEGGNTNAENAPIYKGPASGIEKYALADVEVAREVDFGANNETYRCVTHLGHLIQPGDVVLGYDLTNEVGGDWELDERSFHSNYVLPDVVLVKKVAGDAERTQEDDGSRPKTTKKKEKRQRKNEGKKMKELEESAVRMGFVEEEPDNAFDDELADDAELAAELSALEKNLENFDIDTDSEE